MTIFSSRIKILFHIMPGTSVNFCLALPAHDAEQHHVSAKDMTVFICAVADCKSSSWKKKQQVSIH